MKRVLLALVVLAAASAFQTGVPASTHAQEPDRQKMEQLFYQVLEAKDPEAFVKGLSDSDRALWNEAAKVVEVKEEVVTRYGPAQGAGMLGTSCWTQQKRRVGENFLGYDLWRFYLRINWCENGTWIQSPVSWYNTVDINYPWWSYSGLVGQSVTGGPGYSYYSVFTQGEFKYCPGGTCIQYSYPWINLVGYPGGWSSWTGGGGTGW